MALKLAEKYAHTDQRPAPPPPAEPPPDLYDDMRPEPFGEDDWPQDQN